MFTFPKRKLIRAPIGTRVTNGIRIDNEKK